jgi:hypothetical protein
MKHCRLLEIATQVLKNGTQPTGNIVQTNSEAWYNFTSDFRPNSNTSSQKRNTTDYEKHHTLKLSQELFDFLMIDYYRDLRMGD